MTRIFTLVAGIVFLVAGVLGFMPGITVDHVLVFIREKLAVMSICWASSLLMPCTT